MPFKCCNVSVRASLGTTKGTCTYCYTITTIFGIHVTIIVPGTIHIAVACYFIASYHRVLVSCSRVCSLFQFYRTTARMLSTALSFRKILLISRLPKADVLQLDVHWNEPGGVLQEQIWDSCNTWTEPGLWLMDFHAYLTSSCFTSNFTLRFLLGVCVRVHCRRVCVSPCLWVYSHFCSIYFGTPVHCRWLLWYGFWYLLETGTNWR